MDQQERAPSGNEPPPLSGAPSRSFLRQTTRGDPSAVTGRYSQSLARADAAASASAEEDSDPTAAAAAAEEPLASNDGDDTTTSALDSSQGPRTTNGSELRWVQEHLVCAFEPATGVLAGFLDPLLREQLRELERYAWR